MHTSKKCPFPSRRSAASRPHTSRAGQVNRAAVALCDRAVHPRKSDIRGAGVFFSARFMCGLAAVFFLPRGVGALLVHLWHDGG
jgi:hypothetical protein